MSLLLSRYKKQAADLLRDESTYGVVLMAILLVEYGYSIFAKDVLEVYQDVKEDFDAILSEEGENRLNAMLLATTTDGFYTNVDIFDAICTSLYDGDLGDLVDGLMEPTTVPEMLWAYYEVGLIYDAPQLPSPKVIQSTKNILRQDGVDSLHLASLNYKEFMHECKEDMKYQLHSIGMNMQDLEEYF